MNKSELPPYVEMGAHTYAMSNVRFLSWADGEKIVIGKFCSIAGDVEIHVGGDHNMDVASTFPFDVLLQNTKPPSRSYRTSAPTVIGHDVWIGRGAFIGAGSNIGPGSIIGAKTAVRKTIPPYSIVVGNPGQIIRRRFSDDIVERLLQLAWWEWPDAKIKDNLDWFYAPIGDFLQHFESVG